MKKTLAFVLALVMMAASSVVAFAIASGAVLLKKKED